MVQMKSDFFVQDLKQNGNWGKCTDLTEKLTPKIQTGTEKSIFHIFVFFGILRKMGEKLPQRNFKTQLIWIQSDTVGGGSLAEMLHSLQAGFGHSKSVRKNPE